MISKKPVRRLDREIAYLKRDKYEGLGKEIGSRAVPLEALRSGVTRSNLVCQLDFARDVARLEKGEPLDYVIGWREFLGCKIDLSARPLIPREETEFWVEKAISSLRGETSQLNILDLFSGSGCIGLAVLKHILNAKVTFGEKDPKLCAQIKKNLKLNKLKGRVIQSDIFNTIPKSGQHPPKILNCARLDIAQSGFDVIFANPPYISAKKSRVQKSVKDWEPKEALYAGPDGLAIIKKFLKQAKDYLKPGGQIFMEFDCGQKLAIANLIKQFGYTHYQFNKDQFGKYRWVVVELEE